MLMQTTLEERYDFLTKIMQGVQPAYKITYLGIPYKQEILKQTLPNLYTSIKISERNDQVAC